MDRNSIPPPAGREHALSGQILQIRHVSDLQGIPLYTLKAEIRRRGQSRPRHRAKALGLVFAGLTLLVTAAVVIAALTTAIPAGARGVANVGAAAMPPADEAEPSLRLSASFVPTAANLTPSPELSALFESFDANEDQALDVAEARAFYYWVEKNIEYRYDDEAAEPVASRFGVGDGRAGRNYQQTPDETFAERLGDCEDQGALEIAFYRHYGVPAYMAYVNARNNDTIDHALAIIWAADSLEGLRALVGTVPYYHVQGRPGVEDGYYFLVDNTYSSTFAAVSGGIGAAKFQIHDIRHFEELFADSKLAPILP